MSKGENVINLPDIKLLLILWVFLAVLLLLALVSWLSGTESLSGVLKKFLGPIALMAMTTVAGIFLCWSKSMLPKSFSVVIPLCLSLAYLIINQILDVFAVLSIVIQFYRLYTIFRENI